MRVVAGVARRAPGGPPRQSPALRRASGAAGAALIQYGSIRHARGQATSGQTAGMAGLFGSDTGQGRGSRCCTECRRDLWVLGVSQSAPSRATM